MTATALAEYISFCIEKNLNILIKGKPGIGKSDISRQGFELWKNTYNKPGQFRVWHPVISDPTDFKGLPFAHQLNGSTVADFIPFAQLAEAMNATETLAILIDDIGQAPPTVQAALMQPLLAREIGGKKISDHVRFIAATNRKEDKAAVSGMLEPVKSRFASIIELEVNTDDWVRWALMNNMPVELIAFIRFRPELLDNFQPSKDIVNSPSPRTVANVGRQQNAGLNHNLFFEVFKGAAGEAFSTEYCAFIEMFKNMPNVDSIILNPTSAPIPTEPGILYGLSGALAHKMNDNNIEAITIYLERLPGEIAVCCMKDAITKKDSLKNTKGFIKFATGKVGNLIL